MLVLLYAISAVNSAIRSSGAPFTLTSTTTMGMRRAMNRDVRDSEEVTMCSARCTSASSTAGVATEVATDVTGAITTVVDLVIVAVAFARAAAGAMGAETASSTIVASQRCQRPTPSARRFTVTSSSRTSSGPVAQRSTSNSAGATAAVAAGAVFVAVAPLPPAEVEEGAGACCLSTSANGHGRRISGDHDAEGVSQDPHVK